MSLMNAIISGMEKIGVSCSYVQENGRCFFLVENEKMTPIQVAEKYLEGGWSALYNDYECALSAA